MRWLILMAMFAMAAPAAADQNDPRLPGLFDRLRVADAAGAADLREQIWDVWFASNQPEVDQLMTTGENAISAGQFRAALAMFDAVIERRPDFAEAWNRRATTYYLLGAFDQSEADVGRVLRLEPRHFGALSGLGMILMARERHDEAIAAFERALAIDPNLPGARLNLDMLRRRGR